MNDERQLAGLPVDDTPAVPPASHSRSPFAKIFIGCRGVRAGWKVLLFFLLFAVIALCFQPLVKLLPHGKHGAPIPAGVALVTEFFAMLAVLGATAIMAKWVDHRPWGYFGMPVRNALRSTFWVGAISGVGTLALQLELMHLGGWFDFGALQLHGNAILLYGLTWGVMFLFVGITEEGMLRGYVQRVVTDGLDMLPGNWSFWTSAILFSLLFGASHLGNPGENKFGILMVFVDGMVMCFSLWRTGDLWFAIGNHAAWDWGETFLFGTANSGFHGANALMTSSFHGHVLLAGGTDGPEGSVLALLSEALFLLVIAVIYRQRRFPLERALVAPESAEGAARTDSRPAPQAQV